jgi:hypothetical protein
VLDVGRSVFVWGRFMGSSLFLFELLKGHEPAEELEVER